MTSLADRFRRWYEYERDCNDKTLEMLATVPADRRDTPQFRRAVGRTAHIAAARRRWLTRLGQLSGTMPPTFPDIALADLPAYIDETEAAWVAYLARLDDAELAREFEWVTPDGKRLRWTVEGVLTQTFGHACYHRGQVVQLVAELGGKAVDTDYLYFAKPTPVEPG
ncbi:DinB family protein [bacterium]|nr:DinB family protein [bacterium]